MNRFPFAAAPFAAAVLRQAPALGPAAAQVGVRVTGEIRFSGEVNEYRVLLPAAGAYAIRIAAYPNPSAALRALVSVAPLADDGACGPAIPLGQAAALPSRRRVPFLDLRFAAGAGLYRLTVATTAQRNLRYTFIVLPA